MLQSVLEAVSSPLVTIDSPGDATIAAKLESFTPGGSAKDRPAIAMIEAAERDGWIEPGDRLVEPTSGNTGIGLAIASAVKGYELTIVMPASKSLERQRLLRAYGADLELIDGDIQAAKNRADELASTEGMVQLGQFENPANADAHFRTTAREILADVGDRRIDAFVSTVGTGGTLTGVARRLRAVYPELLVIAVEPTENAVLSTGVAGEDGFQGMGPGFVSPLLDRSLIDRIETVDLASAEAECRSLARTEAILAGQSSGAASIVAKRVARTLPMADPLVVTVFPDSGERYLTVGTFDEPES